MPRGVYEFFTDTKDQRAALKRTMEWLKRYLSEDTVEDLKRQALKKKTSGAQVTELDRLSRAVTEDRHGNPISRSHRERKEIVKGGQVPRGHKDWQVRGREANRSIVKRALEKSGATDEMKLMMRRFETSNEPLTAQEIKTIQGWKSKGFGKEKKLKGYQPHSRAVITPNAPPDLKSLYRDLGIWNQWVSGNIKDQGLRERYGLLSPNIPSHSAMLSGELDWKRSKLVFDHIIPRVLASFLRDTRGNISVEEKEINRARKASTTVGDFKNAIANILRGKTSSSRDARDITKKFIKYFDDSMLKATGTFIDRKRREGLSTRFVPANYEEIIKRVNSLPLTKEVSKSKDLLIRPLGQPARQDVKLNRMKKSLFNLLKPVFSIGKMGPAMGQVSDDKTLQIFPEPFFKEYAVRDFWKKKN